MNKQPLSATLLILIAICLTPTTDAIVIRHDREDRQYRELGRAFPSVCKIGKAMGDGVLVSENWVMTAAHVADGHRRRGGGLVYFGGQEIRVSEYFLHPDWRPMGPHDFALLRLEEKPNGVAPANIYRGAQELGQMATIVGHGATGSGSNKTRHEDGLRRAATNRVDRADRQFIVFTFDPPDTASDLEGIPGPGDSGGPAFLQIDGQLFVAGISSLGEPGENGPGSYGAKDFFGRVSTHTEWLDQVLSGQVVAVASTPGGGESELDSDSPAGKRMKNLLDFLTANDPQSASKFAEENFAGSLIKKRTPEAISKSLQFLLGKFAGSRFVRVMKADDHKIDVMMQGPEGRLILGLRVEAKEPGGIIAIMEGRM